MLGFKRRAHKAEGDAPAGVDDLRGEIDRLTAATSARRDRAAERELLRLRHLAGIELLGGDGTPSFPEPAADLPSGDPLPEFSRDELTPAMLRAGILRDGCVLVRGLIERDRAIELADRIDRLFTDRDAAVAGRPSDDGLYEEFTPAPQFEPLIARSWIREGGGVLAADSPALSFEMLGLFAEAGLPELVGGYLGEAPLLSAHKTTLRKADPKVNGAWHQDGKFLGDVRALNLWLSLSRCGDESPGLDIIPRRLDHVELDRGDDAVLDYVITQERAEEIAAESGTRIARPIFEPGDALFFDELFLHQTASDASMPNQRYAIESWFFGGSAFPADYAPVAV